MKKVIALIIVLLTVASLCACGSLSASQQDSTNDPEITPSKTEEPKSQNDSGTEGDWKKDFESSLFEQYGVTPDRYEDLGNGIFWVYVTIGGNSVPFVTVDSATGEYHG